MAREAGATIYADTIMVNGKDADDFVSNLVHLAQQFTLDQLRAQKPEVFASEGYDDSGKRSACIVSYHANQAAFNSGRLAEHCPTVKTVGFYRIPETLE